MDTSVARLVFHAGRTSLLATCLTLSTPDVLRGESAKNASGQTAPLGEPRLFIREIRVKGVTALQPAEVQRTIQPHLGPGKTARDVESARVALENLYRDKGYQAASVEVPQQQARHGVLFLQVSEGKVGRLRVVGSRYHDIAQIRANAPALGEGKVLDFNAVSQDIVALNQMPDRRVIPEIVPGAAPGTLDVNLKVEDQLPLHGSLELNNRHSTNTTSLRLNAAISYDNLWQAGHSFGASLQTTPEDWFDEVMVYSGFYRAAFDGLPRWTFQAGATKQDSNISTLGGVTAAGRGDIFSLRATRALPASEGLFHSVSLGVERKHFTQQVNMAESATSTPITYFPIGLLYSGAVRAEDAQTDFFAGTTFHLRGMGGDSAAFEENRHRAEPNFLIFHADASHAREIFGGATLTGRVQGQLASGPLLSNEQFAGGGLDTVRGYHEGESLGDYGIIGSVELATPNLLPRGGERHRLTAHAFVDAGVLALLKPLPEQEHRFELASCGIGLRWQFLQHLSGSVNLAVPLFDEGDTESGKPRLLFSVKGQF